MTDLDAIRARDAMLGPHAPYSEADVWEMLADRRALLAEVDRLTALVDLQLAMLDIERARIRARVEGLPTDWSQRVTSTGSMTVSVSMVDAVERAAVLAAIDPPPGEGLRAYIDEGFQDARRKPLGGIEQFQNEDR